MASEISSKAEISPKAKIGNNCKIFPFVYIEDDVEIGDNCIIFPFVSICDGSRIGKNNKIHQGSVIAVVINRGTHRDGVTKIGNNNFLLEGVHISHDTVVGDYCVFGYGVKVAGDCEIHNGVIFSSSAIQNANTRVGRLAMVQTGTSFSQDIPPFVIAGGKPLEYGGPNNTMMHEAGIDEKVQKHIANAYRLLFHGKTSVFDVVNQIKEQVPDSPEIQTIIQFLEGTKRGIMCK